jgi:hypothetical protein
MKAASDASRTLTRHFFDGFFDFGDLSATGANSAPRTIAGVCAAFVAGGLLLARIFQMKYRSLNSWPSADPYLQAVVPDHAFLIAVPMWVVAFVAVLISPSLFPDETDFRILMALPLTRRVVFGAKLRAVARFIGVFIVASHAALLLLFVITAINRWATSPFTLQFGAWIVASLAGSIFAWLAIAAVRAVLLLAVPREHALSVSAALSSAMLFSLVLAVPFIGQLAGAGQAFRDGAIWLVYAPPAWFTGLEQWLLGRHEFAGLAMSGLVALAVAGLVATSAYIFLYRHFDRVILRAAAPIGPGTGRLRLRGDRRPALIAVRAFTALTLRRSVLHQGIIVTIGAVGAAAVAIALLNADFFPTRVRGRLRLEGTITWIPFVLIFATTIAVRAALLLPVELRANWVFRVADRPATRQDQLSAAVGIVRTLGVIVPIALVLPLQWFVLGPESRGVAVVALACGCLFVELALLEWRRVPFTCSYIPGKGFVPQLVILGLGAFWIFTTIGSGLAQIALRAPGAALIPTAIVGALALGLRFLRRRRWQREPIEFEDSLPMETSALRLSGD